MFYQDCIMKPDEEVGIYFLLGRFYVQLHKRFVETKKSDGTNSFAVSFPDYSKRGIGSRIRIFSDSPLHLSEFDVPRLCSRFVGYADYEGIKEVPEDVSGYAKFIRIHAKTSTKSLIRRRSKRLEISEYEAKEMYAEFTPKWPDYPYIMLQSQSTDQKFPLFIKKEVVPDDQPGLYNTYGLSLGGSVPLF